MNGAATITLPSGLWIDDTRHREVELRPVTGQDEVELVNAEYLMPAHRTTLLLGRCIIKLGSLEKVNDKVVRSLTVGDREALLLHLRRQTFGDALKCVAVCPSCKEKMDLELRVGDLLVPPYHYSPRLHETTVSENGTSYQVSFHLPTGADQEEAAPTAITDLEGAVDLLLHRCVQRVLGNNNEFIEHLPEPVIKKLPAIIAELDPQAELKANFSCPSCRHSFDAIFDTGAYFFQELGRQTKDLYREVHVLALNYHWSEAEIMGMTQQKRHVYLELLDETSKDVAGP